jgi:tetratricopeptide (TPR) repeat protein
MVRKGALFLLIKSMTRSEKRYFKLSAMAAREDSNYLLLFDLMEGQQEPDDEAIRKAFEGKTFIKQLHVTKIYLQELIMRTLRNYHAESSVNARVLDLLRDIEILFARELYDACEHSIQKAEKLASEYEKHALLIEIDGWKRRLALVRSSSDKIEGLLDAEHEAIGRLEQLNAYWRMTANIFDPVLRRDLPDRLKTLNANSLQALTLHHHLLYSCYFMDGRSAEAEKAIVGLISAIEQHPHRIKDDPSSYVTAISNQISLLLAQQRWDETEQLIDSMREVASSHRVGSESRFTVRLWLRIFNLELELYRDSQQLDKGSVLIQEVEQYLSKRRSLAPDNYRIMLYYQAASINLQKGDFRKALDYVNKIINENFGDVRRDLQYCARLMNLIIHFELKNIMVLRYATDNCRRFFKKNKKPSDFDANLLSLFSNLSQAWPGTYRGLLRGAYEVLYGNDTAGGDMYDDYIDLKSWIGEKMKGRAGK